MAFAKGTARRTGTVVAVTGAIDLVSDGEQCVVIRNGRPEMGLVTATVAAALRGEQIQPLLLGPAGE